jgi:AcrR family transcriptional regulator
VIKEKVLDVASRLFYEQGYNLTGINQIIEEAAIAKGSLYNHFTSKTELLMAYLEAAEKEWFTELQRFVQVYDSPREKLLALFDYRMHSQQRSGFKGCRFIKICAEVSQEETQVFEFVTTQKERFKKYIRELAKGVYEKDTTKAEELTEMTFLLLEGATSMGAINKSSKYMNNAKKMIQGLL